MMSRQDSFNLILNTKPDASFGHRVDVCVRSSFLRPYVHANSHTHTHTHACLHTQCASKTQQSPPSTFPSLSLSLFLSFSFSLSLFLSLCVSLSRPDMQEFEHELYIATQQPSSEPSSQTNNGQHDNSIMK